jgi:MoaA/NifB/PqqE/SkfB family radical SAM enzyme
VSATLSLWHPPRVPLARPETLWLQVTGTVCNIACRHCFISCGPFEDRLPMMTVPQVRQALDDGEALGFREYYFTGGEPLLHPDIFALIDLTLERGPLTILTNGLLLDDDACRRLRASFDRSEYSLDLRVSLDGMSAGENDPVRGHGTFAGIVEGLRRLAAAGLNPILTVVEHRAELGAADARERFLDFARSLGLARPRVKFLPLLRIGREERRTRGYLEHERVTELRPGDEEILQCASARMVTALGVWPCPILVLEPGARLGATLREALGPAPLAYHACWTCQVEGLQCRT